MIVKETESLQVGWQESKERSREYERRWEWESLLLSTEVIERNVPLSSLYFRRDTVKKKILREGSTRNEGHIIYSISS
jgi:hypothetical protein